MLIEEDVESCASRAVQSQKANPRHHSQKLEVYNEVLRRIREFNYEEANIPDFDDQLWLHFNRLPARYAFDVNVERAEDVIAHMKLLKLAEDPANRPAFQVRLVQDTEELRAVLEKEILKFKEQRLSQQGTHYVANDDHQEGTEPLPPCIEIPSDGTDVWEINTNLLKFENKVGSGSFGDLYKGTYCSQIVAIKVLKPERTNTDMLREFAQEVYIMRKIRHRNVVQFIGACTRPPNLCIVTEFMSRGSLYDFLHKHKGVFKLPSLLRVAIDVSKGMNYLHQNNIIHRDLKTANLLMDENEVVKVADFGVARVKIQSGVMTAETGTYRWMAPEIIEHKPYDQKADVFSFGITLWELLTGELPYSFLTPLQAAVGVVQKGLRPTIPKSTHPKLSELLQRCWRQDPKARPEFSEIVENLQLIAEEVIDEKGDRQKDKSPSHGFLSALKWGHH